MDAKLRMLAVIRTKRALRKYYQLAPSLGRAHPDDAFTAVPYENGYMLFKLLEIQMSQRSLVAFLRQYAKQQAG